MLISFTRTGAFQTQLPLSFMPTDVPQNALHELPYTETPAPKLRVKASKPPKNENKEFGVSTVLVTSITDPGNEEIDMVPTVLQLRLYLHIRILIKK